MTENRLQIEFSEELRGKNALNFWAGVAIIAAALYAWSKGWFSDFAMESGIVDPPADGYGAGFTTLAIDTVCLIGFAGITAAKLCARFAAGIAERFGLVTSGLYAWAAKEKAEPTPDAEAGLPNEARILEALRSIETRLREQETNQELLAEKVFDEIVEENPKQ